MSHGPSPLRFDERGLLPVVAQDELTGEIRMVAWANEAAVTRTLETSRATFYSRSRESLWVKGETSGHGLATSAILVDCDADTLVYLVRPDGPSCHTGAPTCFFRALSFGDGGFELRADEVPAPTLLSRLEATIAARRTSTAGKSYVKSLLDGGPAKIAEKVREEADELARALVEEDDSRVASEAADLLFHALVGLAARGLSSRDVLAELARRAGTSGHEDKRTRKTKSSV